MVYDISLAKHHYPTQVHLLNNGFVSSLLTPLSQSSTLQPTFNQLLVDIYREMFIQVMNHQWPQEAVSVNTRMSEFHPEVPLKEQIFCRDQKAVCVDIARAGMIPSQVLFDLLNRFADPSGIRHDHIFASRIPGDKGGVSHTELSSSKIGGDIESSFVFLPDPMGATGNSLSEVIHFYKSKVPGKVKKFISIHLIITPEFIKKMCEDHPDVVIYTARVDRGLSSKDTLKEEPGKKWDLERGLNQNHYIVPGAGGLGELINNSFV